MENDGTGLPLRGGSTKTDLKMHRRLVHGWESTGMQAGALQAVDQNLQVSLSKQTLEMDLRYW